MAFADARVACRPPVPARFSGPIRFSGRASPAAEPRARRPAAPPVNITHIIRRQTRKSLRHKHLPRLDYADHGGYPRIDFE